MKLWTIQQIDFLNVLKENQVVHGKKEYIDNDFEFGYEWMIDQMKKRIGTCVNNNCYPIWAWFQYESINKPKPDLRSSGFLPKGTKGVRLEIEKEDDSVMLSDFELWHIPLSYKTLIANSEHELKEFEIELTNKGLGNASFDKLPDHYKEKIVNSWDKIFDLDFDCNYYTLSRDKKSIQATFWELEIEEVKKIDYFIAK